MKHKKTETMKTLGRGIAITKMWSDLPKLDTEILKNKADYAKAKKERDEFVKMIETFDAKIAEAEGEFEEAKAVHEPANPLHFKEALAKLLNAKNKICLLLTEKLEVVNKYTEAIEKGTNSQLKCIEALKKKKALLLGLRGSW